MKFVPFWKEKNKMAKFNVRLDAMAFVYQVHTIEADSEEEAFEQALERYGDEVWKYEGVDTDSILVELEQRDHPFAENVQLRFE
jgi:hypothetical protein